ncbi:formate dehydrogenase subunit alpha [uncultured Veillonella sp.]|uniref:formate dehydrogenase subunit alpha n=1 Tax=uncultured Veillonella sp. TaxID=159268 RepID=UPI0025E97DE4|nr:formate dehydrogenase subunit alpha [uncultured Veillonella sp.]
MQTNYEKIVSVCSYCGSGCQIEFTVDKKANRIIEAKGAPGRTNEGRLCLKGFYGWDYLNDPKILTRRITQPMIRKVGKGSELEPVSWDEAIKYTADRLKAVIKEYGPDCVMAAGSARGPGNEAGYITQKFMRAVVGTNNVDHCARICHAASVAGLKQTIGEGAMSVSVPEIEDAEVILNIGYNGATSHPIVARRIVKAKAKGAKIICADPQISETARIADIHLQQKGGTNLLLLNALAYTIIDEHLYDEEFIKEHVNGFEEYVPKLKGYAPEEVAHLVGVTAQQIREAARIYASSKHSIILWGMGITQFFQGVDSVAACSNLAMLTGNYGHYATGVGPVRGQNNVQGTCDMGILPDVYPGYQSVTDDAVREKFEEAWGVKLSPNVGMKLTQVPEYVLEETDPKKQIHAYYIIGEDPAQSDPNLDEIREALQKIDFVIVQDIFMNRTAEYADVILPATAWGEHDAIFTCCDRGFQRVRKVIEPPEGVKTDWEILCLIATAMGYPMHYNNTEEIWDEMRKLAPKFTGATYAKIEALGGVQWPCYDESMEDKGTMFLHEGGQFATKDGRGNLVFTDYQPVKEDVDEEYPLSFCTVREVGHYSARTMTGNCRMLRQLEDEPGWIAMNPKDCEALGVEQGDLVRVRSRRGSLITRCLPTERAKEGATYMTYQWWIGACNELTLGELDPKSKTPEYKYCACRVEKLEDQAEAEEYVKSQYALIRAKNGIVKAGAGA